MNKAITAIIFSLMFGLLSCSKTTPSGFWSNFQKEYLKENLSNQGAWGGYRAMYWQAEDTGTFNSKEVIDYAVKNGWKVVKSVEVNATELNSWNYNNKPIFPLSFEGFTKMPSTNQAIYEKFARWINTDLQVYMFRTGWIIVEPGTNETNEINGFIVLNNEGKEMSVYHLWGE